MLGERNIFSFKWLNFEIHLQRIIFEKKIETTVLYQKSFNIHVSSTHRADKRAEEKEKNMGFSVPGRPKKWRDKAFKVLEESVSNRLTCSYENS